MKYYNYIEPSQFALMIKSLVSLMRNVSRPEGSQRRSAEEQR